MALGRTDSDLAFRRGSAIILAPYPSIRIASHGTACPSETVATTAGFASSERSKDDMSASLTAFLYLVAGVLFILALRGLSHPETSRRGNQLGMAGMAIAVLTTLFGAAGGSLAGRCSSWRSRRRRTGASSRGASR